jgi:hypothetical protein
MNEYITILITSLNYAHADNGDSGKVGDPSAALGMTGNGE